ncbi:uncharacterized protein N7446_005302, partial [Penicillium canescens]|uniref:uncharacterized protein n=1 Tax=Penicillium canescens TaxID=5083 RepID=UPI0026E0835C
PCERCVRRSLECTFDRERPRKKQRTSEASSNVQALFQRIKQLESALVQANPRQESTCRDLANPEDPKIPASSKVNPSNISTVSSGRERSVLSESSPSSSLVFAQAATNTCNSATADYHTAADVSASQLGPNWFFNGIPIFSEAGCRWVSTRTDQDVTWTDICIPIMDFSPLSALPPSFSQEICDLPDQDATREILSDFFRSSFRLTFPVLNRVLFETTMETAYKPADRNMFSSTQTAARACVFGTLSIATRLKRPHQSARPIDADLCAAKANFLLMYLIGDISLETLQTILLLQLQRMFCGHWQGAAFFHSIACRIVCSLRGHIYKPSNVLGREMSRLEREKHQTRTLFWLCYMLDKDISFRTGNPPFSLRVIVTSPHLMTSCTIIPTCQRWMNPLNLLKEKVCRQLFSAQALKYNDNQLLLHIRKLDDEIECWRLSIPNSFRPALFVSENTSPNSPEEGIPHIIRRMSLQLEYHHLVTVIHTTVRKCTPEAADGIEDLHAVVHSSFDLSLVASRSTLSCLRVLVRTIAEQAFRFFTSYFATAAMSLFLNIVIHPLDPQAQLDLELLMSAANTVRSIPARNLTQAEITRIHEESKFVMRLVWLGTCAMTKADRAKKAELS